jgi:Ni,Fe-hydrogenase III small subunit
MPASTTAAAVPKWVRHGELARWVADVAALTTRNPKRVVALGDSGCTAGVFWESYATLGRVPNVIAVDVAVPGCPPKPNRSLPGILKPISAGRPHNRATP